MLAGNMWTLTGDPPLSPRTKGYGGNQRPGVYVKRVQRFLLKTCQHFIYGVDQHCHTMVGLHLRQKQLQQGEHLKKRCKLWAPTWQKKVGWAPEAG